jgi:hypothetical protein
MSRASASTVFEQPIERVWATLRDFNSLPRWLPAVVRSEIEDGRPADQVGVVRRLFLRGSDVIVREKLLGLSDPEHCADYSLLEGPLKVRDLVARIRAWEVTGPVGTFVHWSAEFDADLPDLPQVTAQLLSIFNAGFDTLKQVLRSGG